jgi:hypothetical protein
VELFSLPAMILPKGCVLSAVGGRFDREMTRKRQDDSIHEKKK